MENLKEEWYTENIDSKLDPESAADWWLSKLNILLSSQRAKIREEVEKLELPDSDVACDYANHVERDDVLLLLANEETK
jgi:hypothetical protein